MKNNDRTFFLFLHGAWSKILIIVTEKIILIYLLYILEQTISLRESRNASIVAIEFSLQPSHHA